MKFDSTKVIILLSNLLEDSVAGGRLGKRGVEKKGRFPLLCPPPRHLRKKGLVFKAHRRLFHSTLGSRAIKREREQGGHSILRSELKIEEGGSANEASSNSDVFPAPRRVTCGNKGKYSNFRSASKFCVETEG